MTAVMLVATLEQRADLMAGASAVAAKCIHPIYIVTRKPLPGEAGSAAGTTVADEGAGANVSDASMADAKMDHSLTATLPEVVPEETGGEERHISAGVNLPAGTMNVLAVGSILVGDINIPGMPSAEEDSATENTDRKEYSLEILKEERNELGAWVLMAKHSAYGDEQVKSNR